MILGSLELYKASPFVLHASYTRHLQHLQVPYHPLILYSGGQTCPLDSLLGWLRDTLAALICLRGVTDP